MSILGGRTGGSEAWVSASIGQEPGRGEEGILRGSDLVQRIRVGPRVVRHFGRLLLSMQNKKSVHQCSYEAMVSYHYLPPPVYPFASSGLLSKY